MRASTINTGRYADEKESIAATSDGKLNFEWDESGVLPFLPLLSIMNIERKASAFPLLHDRKHYALTKYIPLTIAFSGS